MTNEYLIGSAAFTEHLFGEIIAKMITSISKISSSTKSRTYDKQQ